MGNIVHFQGQFILSQITRLLRKLKSRLLDYQPTKIFNLIWIHSTVQSGENPYFFKVSAISLKRSKQAKNLPYVVVQHYTPTFSVLCKATKQFWSDMVLKKNGLSIYTIDLIGSGEKKRLKKLLFAIDYKFLILKA